MKKRLFSVLVSLALVGVLGACGAKKQVEDKSKEKAKVSTVSEKEKPILKVSENSIEKLLSYKMKSKIVWESDSNVPSETIVEVHYSKPSDAYYSKLSMEAMPTTEVIKIGNDNWVNAQGQWMKISNLPNDNQQDVKYEFKQYVGKINDLASGYQFVGTEEVNGIKCNKYSINGEHKYPFPVSDQGSNKVNMEMVKGVRTNEHRLTQSFTKPTLKATPGDLSLVLPKRHLDNIIEMIYALDKIAPGMSNYDTLLYGVEVKFYSSRLELTNELETILPNMFAIGDGAGVTRGLSQASASGVHVARSILKRMQ